MVDGEDLTEDQIGSILSLLSAQYRHRGGTIPREGGILKTLGLGVPADLPATKLEVLRDAYR